MKSGVAQVRFEQQGWLGPPHATHWLAPPQRTSGAVQPTLLPQQA
jgi:hypothetical protein